MKRYEVFVADGNGMLRVSNRSLNIREAELRAVAMSQRNPDNLYIVFDEYPYKEYGRYKSGQKISESQPTES